MLIYPAIDLYEGKAVRLFKGDYNQMTVYSENPPEIAVDFKNCGATHMHIVDLQGAKSGTTPNFETVCAIKKAGGLFCEVGGGIRSMEVIEKYISAGTVLFSAQPPLQKKASLKKPLKSTATKSLWALILKTVLLL